MMLKLQNQRVRLAAIVLVFSLTLAFVMFGGEWAIAAALPKATNQITGAWSTLPMPAQTDRMQSVHTSLLPNGKVLVVNGSSFRSTLIKHNDTNTFLEGVDITDYDVVNNTGLLDLESSTLKRITSPAALQYGETNDLFCSGHLQLADGNVLFVSGTGRYYPGGAFTGSRQLNLYHWQTDQWSTLGQLKAGRWYPSLIPLADGKVVIFSGLKNDAPNQINPSLEIYDPEIEKLYYVDLTGIKNSPFNTKLEDADTYDSIDLYPRVFPLADGKLLITGDEAGIAGVLVPHTSKKSYLMSIHEHQENQPGAGRFSVSFEVGPDRAETSKAYGTALQVPDSEDVLLVGGIIGTNSINFGRSGNTAGFPEGARVATSLQRWRSPQASGENNGRWDIVADFLDKPRANLQAVILPSKDVLIVNGGEYPEYKPVYEPLLMKPTQGAPGGYTIHPMSPAKFPRLYHNGALLLPDARVLVLGGNANRAAREKDGKVHVDILPDSEKYYKLAKMADSSGQEQEFNLKKYYEDPQHYFAKGDTEPFVPAEIWQGEIFSPPYLFKSGPRPEILSAPDTFKYGQPGTITVKNGTHNPTLVLIKLGSVTHSFDYGQRLAELPINVSEDGTSVVFTAPTNAHLYPPGYYMAFYLNDLGKPSHAKIVQLQAG
ncbi:MAG: DUF1929 domain-containing protein [Cyanothece sp. SIO1E1]|nr:DUF1929 domain-containing protein [Cyanothece sp. SIO1E1]